MPSVTLADIQEAAERKYGPYIIELSGGQTCTLVNAIRLSKDKRKKVLSLQDKINGEEKDVDEANVDEFLEDMIRLVAKSKADADRLIKAAGGDLAILMSVVEGYSEGSQLGEASGSES